MILLRQKVSAGHLVGFDEQIVGTQKWIDKLFLNPLQKILILFWSSMLINKNFKTDFWLPDCTATSTIMAMVEMFY